MPVTDPKSVRQRFQELKDQRSQWEPLWQDIRDYVVPDLGVFPGEEQTEGGKRYARLYDAEATCCADILAAGLLSGVSSPSRPWLKLTTMDPDLDKVPGVKEYLAELEHRMLLRFAKAEAYNALHQSYVELAAFGQACTIIKPHPSRLLALQNLTIGEYWLSADPYGTVDTMYRRFRMTAKQMVQQWGLDEVSSQVKSAYKADPFKRFDIVHAIEPRWDRDEAKRDKLNKPFKSIYFEEGQDDSLLSESGFDTFPVMCPRWMTCGPSVYGRGPGARALSASKSLQRLQSRLATLVDYQTNPPRSYPASYKGTLSEFRPGGLIPITTQDQPALRVAWEPAGDANAVQALIMARKQEIQRYFFANVFQMIAASAGDQRTATEVQALEQEKVLLLGPVLERLHSELLDPLVSTTFNLMVENDELPPNPPDELLNRNLSVEYISVLAKQQKNASMQGIVNAVTQIGALAQMNPTALDKLDTDAVIDELADMNGVPPSLIVAGQKLALIRQTRAEQQQALAQQQQFAEAAKVMKDVGSAADSQGLQQALAEPAY
jgi:hypothetical protein